MKRRLILLLALALCLSPARLGLSAALAEELAESAAVEDVVPPAESAGAAGLVVEGTEETTGDTEQSQPAPEAAGSAEQSQPAPETADSAEQFQPAPETAAPVNTPVEVPAPAPVEIPAPAQVEIPAPVEVPAQEAWTQPEAGYAVAAPEAVVGDPVDMALGATQLVMGVKESFTLPVALLPTGSASVVTWRSDKPKIVSVDAATGLMKALKKGTATVYATTANGIERACAITVMKAPKKITLNVTSLVLSGGGQSYQLVTTFPSKSGCLLYYGSSDPSVVAVDAAGVLITGNPGTATVTVQTFNGKSASCAVTVLDPSIPVPASVVLPAASFVIGVKQSLALNPAFIAQDGSAIPNVIYTVESSNKKKLVVNADGTLTGAKAGSYTVKVTAYNGVSATCAVKVEKAPSKVAVTPVKGTIGPGQTRQLTVTFPKGGIGTYTFSSSNPGVVSVDANGYITGVQLGTAVITVRTSNGKTAKSTITVSRGPDYVALNADYELQFDPLTNAYSTLYVKTMNPGETFQLTGENEYMTYGDIVGFESTAPNIASVDQNGVITAIAPGAAIIVVRSTSGAEAYCRVTVNGSLPAIIAFTAADATVRAGQTASVPSLKGVNIDAGGLATASYASSDPNVLGVAWSDADAEWKLVGVNPGSAVLTAYAWGATAQLPVTVTPAATTSSELRFESSVMYMSVGDAWKPIVTDEYGVVIPAALTSDNPAVVSVDEAGGLTGLAEGSATVTATWGALTANTSVNVRTGAAAVALNAGEVVLGVGQRFALTASVNGNGSSANLTGASSNPSAATVGADGVVVARAPGAAVITATAYGGAVASCTVSVAPAPSGISIQPASVTGRLDQGGVQLAMAFGAPDEVGSVTMSSSDPAVAVVNDIGYIAFLSPGRTVVTATTNNGLMTSIDVTVLPAKPVSATPTYRLFAAYGYFNSEYNGYIPFTQNNAKSMASVFEHSSISGLGYSTRVMGNPSKNQLLSGISSFFSATTDADVSIVYLCSHGHMTNGYAGYRMSLPGYDDSPNNANYYMTSQEILNCVSRINGSVVLILDSCYSGAFLQDMQGQLDALGGRVAVLTAASDTRATYYKVKKTDKSVDFFTFFLLKGLGYNHRDGWWNSNAKGSRGSYPGYLAADAAGNGDGIVTLGEAFSYASNSIAANIPGYMKKSWYWGDATRVQQPRYYPGYLNDLVVYQPR